MVYIIALATVLFTYLGGQFALRFKDRLHLVVGFSAGAIIGLGFFHLLPESFEVLGDLHLAASLIALGFFAYLLADRMFDFHSHEEEERQTHRASLGAGSIALHSFFDGLAIGFGFQISTLMGLIVALAVLIHKFSDGVNAVGIVSRHGGSDAAARVWLLVVSLAPLAGVAVGTFLSLPERVLGVALSIFCGFFLYIGIADLLHESHHAHPGFWTTAMTLLGAFVLFLVSLLLP
ncbi:ZIP family metal transporter [Candidatus Parcubacteria bacterium]|nr:ZIP family metal transporter [Candidatus Parcubacteria bacterium]